jgi:hypothetical protein
MKAQSVQINGEEMSGVIRVAATRVLYSLADARIDLALETSAQFAASPKAADCLRAARPFWHGAL